MLGTLSLRIEIGSGDAVATAGQDTAVCAAVTGLFVAIVTGLVRLDLAIATFAGNIAHNDLLAGTGKKGGTEDEKPTGLHLFSPEHFGGFAIAPFTVSILFVAVVAPVG